ncbi:MAG: hypothetical protein K2M94_04770, partial [Paramuribaculum sp.]|nr:hypothetical protein [Paramuribaculum sp.]
VTLAGGLVIIKTRNGYAGGVAYDIDDMASDIFLGTIAGADTVFAAVNPNATPSDIYNTLSEIIPVQVMEENKKYFEPQALN